MADEQPLPTELDFDPWGGNRDAQSAWRDFGGRTLEQVRLIFRENPEHYNEHFMWMGGRAFALYFPMIEEWLLETPASHDEEVRCAWMLAHCIRMQFEGNVDSQNVKPLVPRIEKLADFVLTNLDRFDPQVEEQRRIAGAWEELLAQLRLSDPATPKTSALSESSSSQLPDWEVANLPEPKPLGWRNLAGFIGPGIVMCGIQIGGGEWLFGPAITAKYGGGLMWIATIAILCQVFYNVECGRYALYTGEPVFTGFMRTPPSPMFWIGVALLLSLSALIPGLSTNAAVLITALYYDRPPTPDDAWLINTIAFVLLGAVVLPVLLGGKVYNTLQWVMTAKVFIVLGFCLVVGLLFVSRQGWADIFSGFFEFGNVPVSDGNGGEKVVNAFGHYWEFGIWPVVALANIAQVGAFAGYAGGGGLSNSTYSNFVRDKGWGMGGQVGAIASAVGGRNITLSHVGKVFPLTEENLRRWKGWWKYILSDQFLVWAPGCFMGMALPALLSIEFAAHSPMFGKDLPYSQPLIAADGLRHAPELAGDLSQWLWLGALFVGLMVFLPSQMSIVDDVARRWTDILWTGSRRVRETMQPDQVRWIYYAILAGYVVWSFLVAAIFLTFGDAPTLMVTVIANLNNVALGLTSFHVLWINRTLLPPQLRPRWFNQLGIACCGVFYFGIAGLVFVVKILPLVID
jgi:hypothetical protein